MKYDAFISYRHCELDMYVAKKLHKGLETFKVPRAVAKKTGKKSIKRVFRDQEELPIGSDLGDNIKQALKESEYLVVVCSPRTKESYWVNQEIDTFIKMHGRERVLAVLIEGEPGDSFPEQLRTDEKGNPVEPLAADVRGASYRGVDRKLKVEIMRLAAPILGCSYDDLRQRHKERRMKKMVLATSSVAVLGVAFGAYSAYNAQMIRKNYEEKQANQSKYLASTALQLLENGDRQTAALIALEALPGEENDRPYVAEAQYALSETLNCYDTGDALTMDRCLKHDLPVETFVFNKEGDKVLSVDEGSNIYVWKMENGEQIAKLMPEFDDNGRVLEPISVNLLGENVIVCYSDKVCSFDFEGKLNWQVVTDSYWIGAQLHEDTNVMACVSGKGVTFWDAQNGAQIGYVENEREEAFTLEYVFNEDGSKFAVAHLVSILDKEAKTGSVALYDLKTKQIAEYETANAHVAEIEFTKDGNLVVVSDPIVDYQNLSVNNQSVCCVEKLNIKTKEALWQNPVSYDLISLNGASIELKTREYQDSNGQIQDEILMSVNDKAYTWNGTDGTLKAQMSITGSIRELLISTTGSFGFLVDNDGMVHAMDLSTGTSYSASDIEVGKEIRDLAISNGVLVARTYASPELTVMKYHKGSGIKEISKYDDRVVNVYSSEKETYYAVRMQKSFDEECIYFYRTEDDSLVNTYEVKQNKGVLLCGFKDDKKFLIMDSAGNLITYDVKSGKEKSLQTMENGYMMECDWKKESGMLLFYKGHELKLVDADAQKLKNTCDTGEYIFAACLGKDGKIAYCNLEQSGLCEVNLDNGQVEQIGLEGQRMSYSADAGDGFCVSKDGKFLAVACTDATLRVISTESKEIVARIPFAGVKRKFISFMEKDTKLLMQGDDYCFKVYDLKKQEFAYISDGQYYPIESVVLDEETKSLSLMTTTDMVILDAQSYQRTAQVDYGMAYMPKSGLVFCSRNDVVYRFPYMTLPMLLEEAKVQFGDAELTQLERTQYYID